MYVYDYMTAGTETKFFGVYSFVIPKHQAQKLKTHQVGHNYI